MPYLGQITMVGFAFAPKGYAFCDGQLIPIVQNEALFALLGTTYGGDGITTFGLPNLQERAPMHTDQFSGGSTYSLGAAGGEAAHTLSVAEMPAHTHPVNAVDSRAQTNVPGGRTLWAARLAPFPYSTNAPDATLNAAAIGTAGEGLPHENRQPSLVINFVIALQGVFPSRS